MHGSLRIFCADVALYLQKQGLVALSDPFQPEIGSLNGTEDDLRESPLIRFILSLNTAFSPIFIGLCMLWQSR